jgi:hypothetical protein
LNASELEKVTKTTLIIYNALLVFYLKNRLHEERFAPFLDQLDKFILIEEQGNEKEARDSDLQQYYQYLGPFWSEVFREYRRYWLPFIVRQEVQFRRSPLADIFLNLDQYLTDEEKLVVHRATLESPGDLSFTASVEGVVREVKELVQFVFHRKQAKDLTQLDITAKIDEIFIKIIGIIDELKARITGKDVPSQIKVIWEKMIQMLNEQLDMLGSLQSKGKIDIS